MSAISQLETYGSELVMAIKTLSKHCRDSESIKHSTDGSPLQLLLPPETSNEAQLSKQCIISLIARLQTLLNEPTDFLRQLAVKTQLLSCVQWLGEFQILACIPLNGSVLLKDVAEIAAVPEVQLCRIVLMAATAGFLHQPQPGYVAHTALSASFVNKPSLLDAVMFLSETAAPAALQMASATRRFGESQKPYESAHNVAANTLATFASVYMDKPKLQRQLPAYLQHATGDIDASVIDILKRLDWSGLGNACVVEVGARSTTIAVALTDLYPLLRVVVQMVEPESSRPSLDRWPSFGGRGSTSGSKLADMRQQSSSRITIQQRILGTLQSIDAAVYILRLPSPSPGVSSQTILTRITAELMAHMAILRMNSSATLVLTARLLPGHSTLEPDIEAIARLRDLSLIQLTNEQDIEPSEVIDMLSRVRDRLGRLILVNTLRSCNNATVAFEIRHQAYVDQHEL